MQTLHRGEVAAIALCRSLAIEVLLTDDMAVRRAARTLGLRPVGSLGVVVRAYKTGVLSLPEADVILDDLCSRSSLYVTRAIVEMAVEELRRRLDE